MAALPVAFAPGQVVVTGPGLARRFAQVGGSVHQLTGGLPPGPAQQPRRMLSADLDGDGLHEVVLGNSGASSVVLFNRAGKLDPAGAWTIPDTASGELSQVLAVDLDDDCDRDLALARLSGVRVLLNSGKASYRRQPLQTHLAPLVVLGRRWRRGGGWSHRRSGGGELGFGPGGQPAAGRCAPALRFR